MSIDERIRTSLEAGTQFANASEGDVEEAMARGRTVQRRRRGLVVGAAVVCVAMVVVGTALVSGRDGAPTPAETVEGVWTRAAESPLSPRHSSLMLWTGEEVLVIGGHSEEPCPPNADCNLRDDLLRDGAAYDPDTDSWRTIASAPVEMDRNTSAVVSEGLLVVGGTGGAWSSYDPATDSWSDLPPPVDGGPSGPDAAFDGKVYAQAGREIFVLDIPTRTWTALPRNPLEPRLQDTFLFATDVGIVVTGQNYHEAAPDEPTLTQADLWDGTEWRRLPRTGQIGWFYYWTGERILGIEEGGADGGQTNNWGEWYPQGGALDPATGEWEPIPGLPSDYQGEEQRGMRVEAGSGPLVATSGRVYDDRTREWASLGFPDSYVDYEQSATWAGDRLVIFGGYDYTDNNNLDPTKARDLQLSGGPGELSNETWVWRAD